MTIHLRYHLQDTAILKYTLPKSINGSLPDDDKDILFLAKCGIYRLMTNDHPSLSELYKIRFNEHGGLQLNNYQKILKKRLSSLIWDIKDRPDLQLHLLIPQYTGNYFSICVMVSSLKPVLHSGAEHTDSNKLFSSYNNFAVQHSDFVPLKLDKMSNTEIQNLFKMSCTENNNGDMTFELSISVEGIPDFLFEEYHVELGVHEIEVLQSIVNFQLNHYDLPRIQLNDRYARTIGWDKNDHLISIIEPRKIATFGNERIMIQALWILQNFNLKHQMKDIEIINPKNGKRSRERELHLLMDQSFFIITTKAKQWESAIKSLTLNHKYRKEILTSFHPIANLGIDIIQFFYLYRDLLFNLVKSWVNITSSSRSASYEMQSMLELFDDVFKNYGSEQLAEFQLSMFLKESTFEDLDHPELYNILVSKYSSIFVHPFFNYKQKIDISSPNAPRRLWKKEINSPGIHIIDISDTTQEEQLAIQSFFLILQEARYFDNTWTFHSFGDGLRHSFEKVQQIFQGISINKSLLHFTHSTSMPFFLRSFELLLFDRDFATYSVLKAFNANKLFENTGEASLLIYEQSDATLLKPLDLQMLDILYDRNVIVKLAPEQVEYSHDLYPAKELEEPQTSTIEREEVSQSDDDDEETILSQPFVDEEESIVEDFEEDNYIGPDLLFKIPVLATFRSYRQYEFQEIEYTSNLPQDIVQKQLQELISQNWIETTIVSKADVFLPLSTGKEYMDDLIKQIPGLNTIQVQLYDTIFPNKENIEEEEKIIDENNILDVLISIRLSYHNMTDFDERKDTLLNLCSVCNYISDKFGEFDNVLRSYYYWTLGIYASFLASQLENKREENLLAVKISHVINLISDILTEKLQDEFTMDQMETSSDEIFVFTEEMKDDEQVRELPEQEEIILKKVNKKKPNESSASSSPPSVFNIPKTIDQSIVKIPSSLRQLTPQELIPIEISTDLGPWYKFHRVDYDIPIQNDPLRLSADEIIFMFMVNSINNNNNNNNITDSFSIKKQSKSLIFLNRDQVYQTVNRSPLPMKIDYDNLINTGIIQKMDIGYNIVDIRSILSHPNVSIDPMYKRMNLSEVVDLLDENKSNFVYSRTLQSYIYADYYDIELQPVVAICYAILIDEDHSRRKIAKYAKYIPWAYTMIKLFMMKKRDFMRSNELDFIHEDLMIEMQKIRVGSLLELSQYSGEDEIGKKLSFMLRRKLKRLDLRPSDINKHNSVDDEIVIPEKGIVKPLTEKRERITFSPTLIQQIEEEAIIEESQDKTEEKKRPVDKLIIQPKKSGREKSVKGKKLTSKSKKSEISISSGQSDELRLEEEVVSKISLVCQQAIEAADDTSPTDLLISIFATIIYPAVINQIPENINLGLIELFNEVGELTGVSNTVDFSRNLGDMQERWDKYKETRTRIIKAFATRITETATKFVFNSLFKDLLNKKFGRMEK
ncbi:MAG: hypothetical protein HeimC2_10400 [Candidatus Heimdallarchaeota archaeon LC_2]|nr:MAG: hypothetical protein HeimC2_10400 [Candidatus Heimdallarchaeota archaeon LC_2]